MVGADWTTPSSSTATCLFVVSSVSLVNFCCPPPVKETKMIQSPVTVPLGPCRTVAVADFTSVPTTLAGASRYLTWLSLSQATTYWFAGPLPLAW